MIHVPRDRVVPPATLSSATARGTDARYVAPGHAYAAMASQALAPQAAELAGIEELLGGEG